MDLPGFREIVPIGTGGFGFVLRAVRTSTGGRVAIKVVTSAEPGQSPRGAVLREVDAMVRLKSHPYVINLEEVLDTPEGPGIVMEYAAGGSVIARLRVSGGPLPVVEQIIIGEQIVAALEAAHRLAIVHRDVKPSNVLLTNFGTCKLGDFGIAGVQWKHAQGARLLTVQYASPEELEAPGSGGPPTDIYSLGLTLLHLHVGRVPENGERRTLLQRAGAGGADELELLIASMLAEEPSLRPNATDVAAELDRLAASQGGRRLRRLPALAVSLLDVPPPITNLETGPPRPPASGAGPDVQSATSVTAPRFGASNANEG